MVGYCAASGGACRLNCPFPYRTSQSVRFLPKWLQIRSHEPRGGRALRRMPNSIRGEEALLSGASTHVGRAPRENGLRKQDTMSSLFSMKAVSYTHLTAADERSSVDLGGRRIIK